MDVGKRSFYDTKLSCNTLIEPCYPQVLCRVTKLGDWRSCRLYNCMLSSGLLIRASAGWVTCVYRLVVSMLPCPSNSWM